jgi:adenylate cyclase
VLGYSAILSGNFIMAEHWFGASHRDYNPEINRAIRPGSAIDPLASMNAQDMLLLTHQGRFAAAAARGAFARAEAEAFGSPTTTAYVLAHFGLVCAITGDTASAGPIISALQESVERASWLRPHVECLAGWLAARNGDLEAGLAQIKEGLDISAGFRSKMWQPLYTLTAADALVAHNAHAQALAKLDECEHLAATLGQNYVLAELHRLRAEVFAATGNDRVEPELYTALQIARQQGTRFYELRASSSLAARWRANGETDRATALLTPLLASFEDAPDQADLVYARSLLMPVAAK